MTQGSLKLGTLAGIDIRVHYTWFFAFILIAWSLALGYFLTANAGARGIRVDSITLFIFGGVSNITKEASTARDEFLIAVVGPVTSLVLAGLFWAIGHVLPAGTALSAVATYSQPTRHVGSA